MRAWIDNHGYWVAAGAIVAVAALFRAWGVLDTPLEFWADEAWWVANTADRPLSLTAIRPLGFQWLSQALIDLGRQEITLRLPSLIAGVAAVAAVAVAARRVTTARWIALFAAAVVAVHPSLVVFAKEFKPYSLEVALHASFIAWALVCLARRRAGVAFTLAPLAALPFAYNLVFLWPALWLTAWAAPRGGGLPPWPTAARGRWVAVGVVLAVAAVAAHFALYDALGMAERRVFWGSKYDVFPLGEGALGGAVWYLDKTWGLVTAAADPAVFGGVIEYAARTAFGALWLAGFIALSVARRWLPLALLAGPLALAALANLVGYWPYGGFRANLFLLPSCVLVAAVGLQWAWTVPRARSAALLAALVLALALMPWDPSYHRHKHFADGAAGPELTRVLDQVRAGLAGTSADEHAIVADWHSWRPLNHYLTRSPWGTREYTSVVDRVELVRGPVDDAAALAAEVRARLEDAHRRGVELRVWLVITKLRTMAPVLQDETIRAYATSLTRLPVHDTDYFPVVVELVISP